MTKSTDNDAVLSDNEIEPMLRASLPDWQLIDGEIRRRYSTAGWKGTLMLVNTIGHLAEVAWHHPDIHASYAQVVVTLSTHSAGGVTQKDLDLAEKIEEVVCWRPGEDPDSALEGIPDDPRFAYIRHQE